MLLNRWYKIPSKATEGVLVLALCVVLLGKLSLSKKFYNADQKPSVVIANGKIDKDELKKNSMNMPFLLSQLRLKNVAKVPDVEFAIIEPNGQLSVLLKSQERAVKPKDMQIDTKYEGLALPLIIDGEIIYSNLKYANLDTNWLNYASYLKDEDNVLTLFDYYGILEAILFEAGWEFLLKFYGSIRR